MNKYNVGDVVYIGQLNEILKTRIHRLNISLTKQGKIVEYMIDNGTAGYQYSEDRLFSSAEDCKKMYFQEALLNHNSEIERIDTLPIKDTT